MKLGLGSNEIELRGLVEGEGSVPGHEVAQEMDEAVRPAQSDTTTTLILLNPLH